MKKLFDLFLIVLAVIGVFFIIGSVGTSDYMDAQFIEYPVINVLKMMGIGALMILPIVVREVYRGEK